MKKIASQIIIVSLFACSGLAQNFYIVKYGDVLSRIVQNIYPNQRIYGRKGKITEVMKLNLDLRDPNIIYPNQKIYFTPARVVQLRPDQNLADSITPVCEIKENKKNEVNELKNIEKWSISALYGAKYLSFSPSGALGKAEVGVLFLNNIKLNSEFNFNDWTFGFQFDSYNFKYKTLTAGDSDQINAVNLYGSYGWILSGLNIEQNPLFRNNNGNIEMTKMTLMSLSFGAKKDIELAARKPTMLKLKGWLSYPLSSSSDHADIKLSSISGYGLYGELELSRQILVQHGYSLHAAWVNQIGIQKISQKVEWETSVGESESNIINASTSLGLSLKF
jgi:hypothetical protein